MPQTSSSPNPSTAFRTLRARTGENEQTPPECAPVRALARIMYEAAGFTPAYATLARNLGYGAACQHSTRQYP